MLLVKLDVHYEENPCFLWFDLENFDSKAKGFFKGCLVYKQRIFGTQTKLEWVDESGISR